MNIWQIIWLALNMTSLGVYLAKHGQPKEDKYNFCTASIIVIVEAFILTKGGFF